MPGTRGWSATFCVAAGPAVVRILKLLLVVALAAIAVTAGFVVVLVVGAIVVAALLVRLVIRRLAPGGGRTRIHSQPQRTDAHTPASQATIDVVAVEKPDVSSPP